MMKQVKREEELRQAIQTNQRVLRANVKEQKNLEGSLEQLRGELSKATAAYDKMSRAERESAQGVDLKNHINTITKELKGAEEETERFYRNVGNYENSIKNAIFGNSQFGNSLMNISDSLGEGGMSGMLNNAKASVMGFGKAALGLMANPAFLAIAGIAGAGAAFKFWWDYNEGLEKASMLTQQYTGLTGNDMKQVRTEVQSLADMFGKDFGEVLQAANSMSKQFGISMSEAISNLEEGFLRGGDAVARCLIIFVNIQHTSRKQGCRQMICYKSLSMQRSKVCSAIKDLMPSKKRMSVCVRCRRQHKMRLLVLA